jgi:2,4-dienoyl-CoA reductase-like NADH-dependent reductase (Old Yellow Enzyme family)
MVRAGSEVDRRQTGLSSRLGGYARRGRGGTQVIDLHGAHGYLLHKFQLPISDLRDEENGAMPGGSPVTPSRSARWCERRFPIVALVQRLSVVDGVLGGLTVDDSLKFVPALSASGVGIIDTSPEGIGSHRLIGARLPPAYAFHAPLFAGLRSDTGLRLGTVGLIAPMRQTEAIRRLGAADLVSLGRQALTDSYWPHHARPRVDSEPCNRWHAETGRFLRLRAAAPTRQTAPGEGPTSGYLAEERQTEGGA